MGRGLADEGASKKDTREGMRQAKREWGCAPSEKINERDGESQIKTDRVHGVRQWVDVDSYNVVCVCWRESRSRWLCLCW